jgi:hypothetical protein
VATAETAAAPTDAAAAAGDAGPTPEPVAEGGMTAQDAQWSDGETQDWADYLALAKAQGALPTFTVDPQNTVVAALLNEARKAGKPDVGDQKQAVLGRKGKTTNYALFAFGPRGRRPIGIGIVDGEVTVTQGEGQVLANLPNPANKTGKMLQDIGGIGTVPAGWVVTAGQQLEQQGADTFIAMSATTDKKTGKLTLSLNGTEQIKVTSWVPVGDDDGNIIIGAEALPDVPLQ